MSPRGTAVATLLVLLLSGCGARPSHTDAATTPPPTTDTAADLAWGWIEIKVLDIEQRPIDEANVILDGAERTITRFDGKAVFSHVASGAHSVLVNLTGYIDETRDVTVNDQATSEVPVALTQKPAQLIGITTYDDDARCRRQLPTDDPVCDDGFSVLNLGPFPPDLYDVPEGFLEWGDGGLGAMSFRLWFHEPGQTTAIPLRDGRLTWDLQGTSRLNLSVAHQLISKPLRREGVSLAVQALRPTTDAPATFDEDIFGGIFVRYRDPSTVPKAPNRTHTIVWDQEAALPKDSSGPAAHFDIPVAATDAIHSIEVNVTYDCPTISQGAGVRLRAPDGRSVDIGLAVPERDVSACLGAAGERQGPRQVLWDSPGTWTLDSFGECACSIHARLSDETWPS